MKKYILIILVSVFAQGMWAQVNNASVELHKPFYTGPYDAFTSVPLMGAELAYRLNLHSDKLYMKLDGVCNVFKNNYYSPTGIQTRTYSRGYKLGLGIGYNIHRFHPSLSLKYNTLLQRSFQPEYGLRIAFATLDLGLEFDLSDQFFANLSYNIAISRPDNYFTNSRRIAPGGCVYRDIPNYGPNLAVGIGFRF